MDKEIRSFDPTDCEVRATRRGRNIEGIGIVFNKLSKDLGGFKERIDPSAIEGIIEQSDILALLNHDESRGVLARSTNGEGTLELSVDKNGVRYRFEAPDTTLGDEVLSGIRRGDIRTSSFAFTCAEDDWEKQEDDSYIRTIKKFKQIYDVSPVYREAYADTTVAVRSLVEVRTSEAEKIAADAVKRAADLEKELQEKKTPPSDSTDVKPVDPVMAEDLTEYFKELRNKIKK